jgi:hypothetical protein
VSSAKAQIRAVSVADVVGALELTPTAWPLAQDALLAFLDALISAVPAALKPGLQALRDQLAAATTVPTDIVDQVLKALKAAVLAMDFGPATGDDSDLA